MTHRSHRPSIPHHWSPAQATAVYELLQHLTDQLWEHYQDPILAQLNLLNERHDYPPADQTDPLQSDRFDSNDTLPF